MLEKDCPNPFRDIALRQHGNMRMKRIVFVDDDQTEIVLLRRLLRDLEGQWQMTFVESGREALDAMEEAAFDAIVTDMQMPGWFVSGGEVQNRRSAETTWYPDGGGAYSIIGTVRARRSRGFAIEVIDVNVQ